MKHLDDLTIKEFEQFTELMSGDDPDIYGIFELFGMDANKQTYAEFEKNWNKIKNMTLSTKGVKKVYNINGRKFKACLNPLKLKAGQYIDFQSYMSKEFKIENVLSVFLLPMERKNIFGKLIAKKYNENYDVFEVQQYLYNNMRMAEANELSNFFLTWSVKLIKTMKDYSEKKLYKMMKKQNKNKLKTPLYG